MDITFTVVHQRRGFVMASPHWHDHDISVADGVMAARDYGGVGHAVVLVPGSGRNLYDWHLVARRLVDSHRVITVDLPGHGRSSEPPNREWDWTFALRGLDAVVTTLE